MISPGCIRVPLTRRGRTARVETRLSLGLIIAVLVAGSACRKPSTSSTVSEIVTRATGTIRGHVRLTGMPPERTLIRMKADLMCDRAHGGRQAFDEAVLAGPDGSLANAFIQLDGDVPESAAPTEPVVVDQRGCVYVPRVVGVQLGQPLHVRNSDPGLHNVHGVSPGRDGFNIGQPIAGLVNEFRLKDEGILRLQCDVHTWMVAHVVVVRHPYFAVTDTAGTFELHGVPVGTQTVRAWHERYGPLTSTVRVDANAIAEVDFIYPGDQPSNGRGRGL